MVRRLTSGIPMNTITDDLINQMAECIVKEVNPVRIILFGSSASGLLEKKEAVFRKQDVSTVPSPVLA